jgi:hypothetical protein
MIAINKMHFLSAFTLLCCALTFPIQAQVQNCGFPAGTGGTIGATDATISIDALSPDPMFSGESSGLTLVEFLFINPNNIILDTFTNFSGPEIIGSNTTGQIIPSDLGLVDGDQFCVLSFSFALDVLQDQIDTLYNGEFLTLPCCDFAEFVQGVDVCSLLVDAGVTEGADITNAAEVVDFAVNYGISPTLESLFALIDSVINIVPTTAGCVSGSVMCYATSNQVCYTIGEGLFAEPVTGKEWINGLESGPNPTNNIWGVRFETEYSGPASLLVTDLAGRIIQADVQAIVPGSNYIPVDMSAFAPGQYLITLKADRAEEWTIRAKTIKQ